MKTVASVLVCAIVVLAITGCVANNRGSINQPSDALLTKGIVAGTSLRNEGDVGGCIHDDFEVTVTGEKQCLIIATYRSERLGADPTLVVFVHGDCGPGRWEQLIEQHLISTKGFRNQNLVLVSIVRPAYSSMTGRSSGNRALSRHTSYTEENIAEIMAAIDRLAAHYEPKTLIAFGSSGGAATLASGLGLYPKTAVTKAVLVACPCHLPEWRSARRWGPGPGVSPHSVITDIRKDIPISVIVGTHDSNTFPGLSKVYVEKAKAAGLTVDLIYIPGGTHSRARWHDEFLTFMRETVLGR